MKTAKPLTISRTILLLVIALAGFSGCASTGGSNTGSLPSQADVGTRTPPIPQQQPLYSKWPAAYSGRTGSGLPTTYTPKLTFSQVN